MSAIHPLSEQELYEQAPSLFAPMPYKGASERYHFIPTIEVIERMRQQGWYPVSVQEAGVHIREKEGFQRHLVRLRHFEELFAPSGNAVELLLFNSHDRSTAFSVSVGIYRFVCANGLVVSESVFETYRIRHIGERHSDVEEAVNRVSAFKPKLQRKIERFGRLRLSEQERQAFARAAIPLRFQEHLHVPPLQLLLPHREEDESDDLYTVMNVIQENLIRGGLSGRNEETGRPFTSRELKSLPATVAVNRGLWSLAERIAHIKEAA